MRFLLGVFLGVMGFGLAPLCQAQDNWPEGLSLTNRMTNGVMLTLDKNTFKKNHLVVLTPLKDSIHLLNPSENPAEKEKEDQEAPHYKTIIKEIFKLTIPDPDNKQIQGVIFISSETKPVLFNGVRNKELKAVEEAYKREFKRILMEYGSDGSDIYSDEQIDSNAKEFRKNFWILRDGTRKVWQGLSNDPQTPLDENSPAIFVVQPGGKISLRLLDLTPDEIHKRRNDISSGAENIARQVVESLE